MSNIKGFTYGALSSAFFGSMPLFTLPLFAWGMNFHSVLFYRFCFAAMAIAILMRWKRIPFRVTARQTGVLFLLAAFYVIGALFLYWGYILMSSGTATTIHFTYPIFVTIIMIIAYHERLSIMKLFAILLAVLGVTLMSYTGEEVVTLKGLFLVLLSALGYAIYLITVNKSNVAHLNGFTLTFYVMTIGGFFFLIITLLFSELNPINNIPKFGSLLLLALVPTIFANLFLVRSLRLIGSTLTAVLGALEPLTAVCIGILFFNEPFSFSLGMGILVILISVTIIVTLPYWHIPQKRIMYKWLRFRMQNRDL